MPAKAKPNHRTRPQSPIAKAASSERRSKLGRLPHGNPVIPHEFKVIAVRSCPFPMGLNICTDAAIAVKYWRRHVTTADWYSEEKECLVALILDVRQHIRGHYLIAVGTLDSSLQTVREVFRPAIIAAGFGIILVHNHPSGDPTPSPDDIRVTRHLAHVGHVLQIQFFDHVIVAGSQFKSLSTELGGLDSVDLIYSRPVHGNSEKLPQEMR